MSGQTLDAYLAEHLFAPLGMVDTTFSPTDEQRARLMPLRARTLDGALVAVPLELPPDPEWASGGGGSWGTVTDYGRFIRAMLNDGELDGTRVVGAGTVELAFTDQLGGVPLPEVTKSADPTLTNDIPTLPEPQGWGLGFHLFSVDMPGMRSAGSGDWCGLLNCYYWIDRAAGVGAALMTQVLPFYDAAIVEAAQEFEVAVYAQVRSAATA